MKITVADHAGFCFGVERAVSKVFSMSDDKNVGRIYTVGSLIHNPHIINELRSKGVSVISPDNFSDIFRDAERGIKSTVVIRTHGVRKEILEKLKSYSERSDNFMVADLTCPYVKKIHSIVLENRDKQLIVFGDAHHPEVDGIVSYSDNPAAVISSPDMVYDLEFPDTGLAAVAQTTQKLDKWEACKARLSEKFSNIKIFDTICHATEERQNEASELSKTVDLMIVIGGNESSNTEKLYQTAKKSLDATYKIEDASELDGYDFTAYKNVGITAGASTPSSVINEVKRRLELMSTD